MFGQTGPKVGSFDAGYGSTQLARLVGQKKAREVWFLARLYSAREVRNRSGACTLLMLLHAPADSVVPKVCLQGFRLLRPSRTLLCIVRVVKGVS